MFQSLCSASEVLSRHFAQLAHRASWPCSLRLHISDNLVDIVLNIEQQLFLSLFQMCSERFFNSEVVGAHVLRHPAFRIGVPRVVCCTLLCPRAASSKSGTQFTQALQKWCVCVCACVFLFSLWRCAPQSNTLEHHYFEHQPLLASSTWAPGQFN